MKNSEIISKIILCLIILGIVLGIVVMIFHAYYVLNDAGPDLEDPNDPILDTLIPIWLIKILQILFLGVCISFPIAVLCIIYFLIKGKPKHEE